MNGLARTVAEHHGPVSLLMNNAGVGAGGDVFADPAAWDRVIGVNLLGVLHGVQAFVRANRWRRAGPGRQHRLEAGHPQPPGDTAYNVSNAGVKALTEGLAHTLREHTGDLVTAHLLIPRFTYTGMTAARRSEKPSAAWTPEQIVALMMERLADGDFYILCPDNETTPEQDARRVAWAAGDLIQFARRCLDGIPIGRRRSRVSCRTDWSLLCGSCWIFDRKRDPVSVIRRQPRPPTSGHPFTKDTARSRTYDCGFHQGKR